MYKNYLYASRKLTFIFLFIASSTVYSQGSTPPTPVPTFTPGPIPPTPVPVVTPSPAPPTPAPRPIVKGPAKVESIELLARGRAAMLIRLDENDLIATGTDNNGGYCEQGNQLVVYKDSLIFDQAYTLFLAAQQNQSTLKFSVSDFCDYGMGREIISVVQSTRQCDEGYTFTEGACRTPFGCIAPELELLERNGMRPVPGEPLPEDRLSCTSSCEAPYYRMTGPGRCIAYLP